MNERERGERSEVWKVGAGEGRRGREGEREKEGRMCSHLK